MDQFLPYLERMGAGAGIIFFLLFMRSEAKRDDITKQLIALLPQAVTAMQGMQTALDVMREREFRHGRRDAEED